MFGDESPVLLDKPKNKRIAVRNTLGIIYYSATVVLLNTTFPIIVNMEILTTGVHPIIQKKS